MIRRVQQKWNNNFCVTYDDYIYASIRKTDQLMFESSSFLRFERYLPIIPFRIFDTAYMLPNLI
jgi:hypothetical protein